MEFSVSEVLSPIVDALVVYALDVAGALAILVLGYLLAGWATRLIREQAAKTSLLDPTIGIALGKVARVGILTLTLIAVLNRVGVPTASLLAVLGTAGLTISLALQGMLRNVAAGAMLLTLRPFGVGDSVKVGGCEAVVDEIGLFLTRLHTFDNIAVAIPNHEIWGSEIRNYSKTGPGDSTWCSTSATKTTSRPRCGWRVRYWRPTPGCCRSRRHWWRSESLPTAPCGCTFALGSTSATSWPLGSA